MRKKYPSQIRYETKNPTITFRMKIVEKEKIQNMAIQTGKSVSELVRYALLNLEKDFTEIYNDRFNEGKIEGINEGYKKGFNDGEIKGSNDWAISIPCYICHKLVYIKPNSEEYNETFKEMRGRLKHATCYW